MDRSKLIYKSKLPASTILEVIIAMVIILLVFTIAMMISANVMRSSTSVKKLAAQALIHELLIKAEQGNNIDPQNITVEDFRVEQTITQDANFPDVLDIELVAYDINQTKVADLKKAIVKK
jgi:type II secretory pathway pseudopilin PulG